MKYAVPHRSYSPYHHHASPREQRIRDGRCAILNILHPIPREDTPQSHEERKTGTPELSRPLEFTDVNQSLVVWEFSSF